MAMSQYLLIRVTNFLKRVEYVFPQLFGRNYPPHDGFCIVGLEPNLESIQETPKAKFSLKDLLGDGILWAVPKHRRSLEKRLNRKYGYPEYVWKLIKPKTNLRVCNQCGHDHEVGILCPHCYKRVRTETEQMQEQIQEKLGLDPVEQEVVVLYEGEKTEQSSEFLNGKRIIEMKKPRPMWFSKNLLQKSTQPPATTKDIKPDNLG